MIRLPTLTARRLGQALKAVGFKEVKKEGSHLILWNPERMIHLCLPMHGGDLRQSLVRAVLQYLGLKDKEFLDLF